MKPLFILPYEPGAVKLTLEQARLIFSEAEIQAGHQNANIQHVGPWNVPFAYTALCTSNTWAPDVSTYLARRGPLHVYGKRTLTRPQQSGYQLEGRVSIGGKRYRAFTSSQLFELPDGRLIDAATIHACGAAS